jgi:chromosomal replication initiation ATPase DnaA
MPIIMLSFFPGSILLLVVRYFTSLSLAEMGQLFEMDYSVVPQAAKRFEQESKVNHEIKEIKPKMITVLKEN